MYKPYCGIRNPPKNRVRGTSEQCINAGQARYYGIMSVENSINKFLAEKRKSANEKAKIKRKKAIKSTNEANKLINKTNVAVRKAKKDQLEAKKAGNEAKKRGRPKKNQALTIALAPAPAPAKKRGRPPKNNTAKKPAAITNVHIPEYLHTDEDKAKFTKDLENKKNVNRISSKQKYITYIYNGKIILR